MEWWIWITKELLFCFRYSKLYPEKFETLTSIPPIHAYINRSNNRLVFELKDG